ncbi:MAG: DUF4845 domain-containing protein [Gammaproteobacteria bacterium]|nr:DUF4845 domain-containing protein [Gammaproteobacteria bacterium]MBU1414811.1 DUF4845 domain-containing protein [Gammaproteobacteria bacterium]
MNKASQRGITVTGLLFGGMILVLLVVLGMKVVPEVIEYSKIVSDIKAVAADPALRDASPADVRKAFSRFANIDVISAITAQDLEITRGGGGWVLSFAYRKEIPLVGPVSLVIDFEATSDQ